MNGAGSFLPLTSSMSFSLRKAANVVLLAGGGEVFPFCCTPVENLSAVGESVKAVGEKEENSSEGRFWGRRKAPRFSIFC